MNKPRAVHVIDSLAVGGAEMLLAKTLPLLPELDHIIVTVHPRYDLLGDIGPRVQEHIKLDASAKSAWPGAILRLRQIIKRHQPSLVHAHLQISGLIARLACPAHIPLFYTLHNLYSFSAFENRLAILAERVASRPFHHLIGVSRAALDDYVAFVPNSGTRDVLYNFVDDRFFASWFKRTYRPHTPLRCVSVGTLKRQKNYLYTLRNIQAVRDLPVSLDIYGAGPEEEALRNFIQAEGLDQIQLRGQTRDVASVLPHYDLYIISSLYEGFGIAPLEAMAAGVPTATSDIPVFREVTGGHALYFDLGNERGLAHLLRRVYNGEVDLAAAGAEQKIQASSIASSTSHVRTLRAIYSRYADGGTSIFPEPLS